MHFKINTSMSHTNHTKRTVQASILDRTLHTPCLHSKTENIPFDAQFSHKHTFPTRCTQSCLFVIGKINKIESRNKIWVNRSNLHVSFIAQYRQACNFFQWYL